MPIPQPHHRHKNSSSSRSKEQLGDVRWCAEVPREPACVLYAKGSGTPLDEAAKEEMLRAARAGEVVSLEVEAVTFIQRDTPNRNFVRFKPGMLATFAKSFEGQPMLRDHASWSMAARGGTILASKLEHNDDGSKQIRMRLELVKPWAVEAALDGTLDRFSIGWSRTGIVECSFHCAAWSKCDCWPGDTMSDGTRMQLVFTAADGTEVSGVNVPAVVGTRIEAIQQLTAIDDGTLLADILAEHATHREQETMKPEIYAALVASLGLSATATHEEVAEAAQAQADKLKIAESKGSDVAARLAAVEKASTDRAAAERITKIDDSIAKLIAAGKLKPDPAPASLESALRRSGARDFDVFAATVADMLSVGASITPVGKPALAITADPNGGVIKDGAAFLTANPEAAKWLSKAGVTPEQFEKHGANAREIVESLQGR